MGKYFGTDGFRGEANATLTVEHAYKIGRFLGWYYKNKSGGDARIVIAKDTRRSSYMFEYSLAAGITASGADAYLIHVTTTPSVSYVARTEEFDCGIMISASHNPYYDNGIKLVNNRGEKMDDDVISKIEAYLDGDEGDVTLAKGADIGYTVDYISGRNRYMGYIISLAKYSFRGVKVGLDAANGSAWRLAKSVFDALGAETCTINAEPDGFNINKDCGSTHMEPLSRLVKEKGLDIGFAFDGDADRCLAVDENGKILNGDHIMYVCAKYLKEKNELGNNKIVATVMSNFGFFKAMKDEGIDCAVTDVGDRNVYTEMQRGGYVLGGEQSGHIIFSKYSPTGDGLITAIKLMEVVISKKKTLSELTKDIEDYPQVLINVPVKNKDEVMADAGLEQVIENAKKTLSDSGRILVRKSGTEPLVRVMVEAKEEKLCREIAEDIANYIKKHEDYKKGIC